MGAAAGPVALLTLPALLLEHCSEYAEHLAYQDLQVLTILSGAPVQPFVSGIRAWRERFV